jgi:hypothetical protein
VNDARHVLPRRVVERVRFEQHFERASSAAMRWHCAAHIEWDAVHAAHAARAGHKLKRCVGIDELADRPRGGDAVDVHALAGDVVHG